MRGAVERRCFVAPWLRTVPPRFVLVSGSMMAVTLRDVPLSVTILTMLLLWLFAPDYAHARSPLKRHGERPRLFLPERVTLLRPSVAAHSGNDRADSSDVAHLVTSALFRTMPPAVPTPRT